MANTKSAIKRIRRISKQTAVNKARKSRYKNALKKMDLLILLIADLVFAMINGFIDN